MSIKLEVLLDPEVASYTSGQELTGWVKVTVKEVTKCRAIVARATGLCEVIWMSDDAAEKVRDSETYLDSTIRVWSGTDSDDTLTPGEFHFPFSFHLPNTLPPSYKGKYGHIRYSVEAWNEVPKGVLKSKHQVIAGIKNASTQFTVIGLQDLTADPKLAEPLPLCKEETVCCWCCQRGTLTISLTAEKGGYVAGEFVLVSGEIANHTAKAVEDVTISVLQRTTFYGKYNYKEETRVLQEVMKPGFGRGMTDVWEAVPIRVPSSAVSLEHCNIISTDFKIKVSFLLGTFCCVEVENTIQLGTIPVALVAFTLKEPSSSIYSSISPHEDTVKAPLPIQEQPKSLPYSTDSTINDGGEEDVVAD